MITRLMWTTWTYLSLNSSLGLAGGKYYQKITIPILFFKILLFQVAFLIFLFYHYHYLCSLLSSTCFCIWVVITSVEWRRLCFHLCWFVSGGKFSHFDMIREFPHDQYESSKSMDFHFRSRAWSRVVLISVQENICLHNIVRCPLQHGPADSPRTSMCQVVSDIDLTICLPYESGSTPQHDSRQFRLTYMEEVPYGFLVWFAMFWSW